MQKRLRTITGLNGPSGQHYGLAASMPKTLPPCRLWLCVGEPPRSDAVSYVKKKWEANKDKVYFAKNFPGLKTSWEAVAGKTLEAAVPFQAHGEGVVLVFTDGDFFVARQLPDTPQTLIAALEAARSLLIRFHKEAYEKLDALAAHDGEMRRMARMERIVDAVKNNIEEIPELRAALKELLSEP